MPKVMRGARPSPRHKLAAARPHIAAEPVPSEWLWLPSELSFWGNERDGDCVTAEEAFAKACAQPEEILIPDAEAIEWATQNGFLNGAELTDVMKIMQKDGFFVNGRTYNDGAFSSVDWTNGTVTQSAIFQGPVKIAIAADQIENVYQAFCPDAPKNGWLARGFSEDQNTDHCVSLCGYGPIAWLKNQLGSGDPADSNDPGYAMFTWSSVGVIDIPSLIAICGEAWVRNPTTLVQVSA